MNGLHQMNILFDYGRFLILCLILAQMKKMLKLLIFSLVNRMALRNRGTTAAQYL